MFSTRGQNKRIRIQESVFECDVGCIYFEHVSSDPLKAKIEPANNNTHTSLLKPYVTSEYFEIREPSRPPRVIVSGDVTIRSEN
jgi:hypothetical protein